MQIAASIFYQSISLFITEHEQLEPLSESKGHDDTENWQFITLSDFYSNLASLNYQKLFKMCTNLPMGKGTWFYIIDHWFFGNISPPFYLFLNNIFMKKGPYPNLKSFHQTIMYAKFCFGKPKMQVV